MKKMVVFIFLFSFLSSCGVVTSASAIRKAEAERTKALKAIALSLKDEKKLSSDPSTVLSEKTAVSIYPVKDREMVFFYFLGQAYLNKARELQSDAIYETATKFAEKSEGYLVKSASLAAARTPVPPAQPQSVSPTLPVQQEAPPAGKQIPPAPQNASVLPVSAPEKVQEPKAAPSKTLPVPPASSSQPPLPSSPASGTPVVSPPSSPSAGVGASPATIPPPVKKEDDEEKKKEDEKKKKEEIKPTVPSNDYLKMYEELKKKAQEKKAGGSSSGGGK